MAGTCLSSTSSTQHTPTIHHGTRPETRIHLPLPPPRPATNNPTPHASPHVSPHTLTPPEMPDDPLVPSAHYYPPTWESQPMLPRGSVSPTPPSQSRTATTGDLTPLPKILVQQPTPQTPMSIESQWSATRPTVLYVDEAGDERAPHNSGWGGWLCCVKKKVGRAVHGDQVHHHGVV